jgi:hypothetical protein
MKRLTLRRGLVDRPTYPARGKKRCPADSCDSGVVDGRIGCTTGAAAPKRSITSIRYMGIDAMLEQSCTEVRPFGFPAAGPWSTNSVRAYAPGLAAGC